MRSMNGTPSPTTNGVNGSGPPLSTAPGRYAQIVGWGMHVPDRVVTNDDLSEIVKTTDEWIRSRTGIAERRIVSRPDETTASLAVKAARGALRVSDVPASALDMIICATTSPDYQFPATACLIQDALGAINAGAYDLSAACSGFVYGLAMARGMILAGDADYVMVIGSETLSRLLDWTDRSTCILFGDGAGAVLLAASEEPGGIMSVALGSDGSGGDLLILPGGGSANPTTLESVASGQHYLKMDGKAVFRFATRAMAEGTRRVVARAGMTMDEVDLVIPHQANRRIIQSSVIKQLKIPEEKVFVNLERYGNTSTASIPIALCEAIEAKRVEPGQNIVFVGFGAGLTWGATAIKWCAPVNRPPSPWWKTARRRAGYQIASARSLWRRAARRAYASSLGPADAPTRRGRLRASIDAGREVWDSRSDRENSSEES
ncbi:MAG: beta-ketoacyl-ACP synthase III [Chloroflexota bacterium]|nr:beta-ketoacyl-ACP synthase III [Chloroflexota bacterium]